jgi:hypothetical protein
VENDGREREEQELTGMWIRGTEVPRYESLIGVRPLV